MKEKRYLLAFCQYLSIFFSCEISKNLLEFVHERGDFVLTAEDYEKMAQLMRQNDEFSYVVRQITEENKYLLSKTSHELRNMLTLIGSSLQLMEKQHPEVAQFKYWNQITQDLETTNQLLVELSGYNESKDMIMQKGDLAKLISNTVASFQSECLNRGILLKESINEETLEYTKEYIFDHLRLKQALVNLIKNAMEACEYGDTITVSMNLGEKENDDDQNLIVICISDTGTPIDEENLASIFEPYYTTKESGTGLGLAIVKSIILRHGGDIQVNSTSQATSFLFELPLVV